MLLIVFILYLRCWFGCWCFFPDGCAGTHRLRRNPGVNKIAMIMIPIQSTTSNAVTVFDFRMNKKDCKQNAYLFLNINFMFITSSGKISTINSKSNLNLTHKERAD